MGSEPRPRAGRECANIRAWLRIVPVILQVSAVLRAVALTWRVMLSPKSLKNAMLVAMGIDELVQHAWHPIICCHPRARSRNGGWFLNCEMTGKASRTEAAPKRSSYPTATSDLTEYLSRSSPR